MICVGIDVAKDKHDCFILSSEGEVLADVFTISNNAEGFDTLLQTIHRCARPEDKIKVGLEATGHFSCISLSRRPNGRQLCYTLFEPSKIFC